MGSSEHQATDPDPDLGLLTDRVTSGLQRVLRANLVGKVRRLGPRHRAVLAYLDVDGTRATALARRCGQHKQVMGSLIDDLEQLGYVRREPDPTDRRAKLVIPTRLGREQLSQIEDAVANIEQQLAATLGEPRYDEFKRSFQTIANLLSEDQSTTMPADA